MFIDLSGLLDNPGAKLRQNGVCDFSEWLKTNHEQLSNPIPVTVAVRNENNIITVEISATYRMMLSCDRCAEPFELAKEDCFTHTVDYGNAVGEELLEIDESARLDIDPILWSDIFCALPDKILCRPDCKGLCLHCGKSFNNGDCGCSDPKHIL